MWSGKPGCNGGPGLWTLGLAPRLDNDARTTRGWRSFQREAEILGSDTRPIPEPMWVGGFWGILPSGRAWCYCLPVTCPIQGGGWGVEENVQVTEHLFCAHCPAYSPFLCPLPSLLLHTHTHIHSLCWFPCPRVCLGIFITIPNLLGSS